MDYYSIELSVDLLHLLHNNGFRSISEPIPVLKEEANDDESWFELIPSMQEVPEEGVEIDKTYYYPILSNDILEMAQNNIPFTFFLLKISNETYFNIAVK